MKQALLIAVFLLAISEAHCGDIYERVLPAGNAPQKAVKLPIALALQSKETVRDLATFRNTGWDALTISQIAACVADAKTSLTVFDRRADYEEIGVSRYVVGVHPDAHKYIIAGAVEIGVEAVAAHYFRTHGPLRKWYWKYLCAAPQSISVSEHSRAALLNMRNY